MTANDHEDDRARGDRAWRREGERGASRASARGRREDDGVHVDSERTSLLSSTRGDVERGEGAAGGSDAYASDGGARGTARGGDGAKGRRGDEVGDDDEARQSRKRNGKFIAGAVLMCCCASAVAYGHVTGALYTFGGSFFAPAAPVMPPPPPPSPPPPPKVDCDSSHGDRATGLYQEYNHKCTRSEAVPAGCVGDDGCQFCHIEDSPAAEADTGNLCSSWVCEKYGITGCHGVPKNAAKEAVHYDIGDCKVDIGNRNVGRYVFRDWNCANDEGAPSACQAVGETPCRLCMTKSIDDTLDGWPYCPKAVCHHWHMDSDECPGVDYVAGMGHAKHSHHKANAVKEEDDDDDSEHHHSSKHDSKKGDDDEDNEGHSSRHHSSSKKSHHDDADDE